MAGENFSGLIGQSESGAGVAFDVLKLNLNRGELE